MSKTIEEQIVALSKQISSLREAFTNRTGDDIGKITDQDATQDIACLVDTLKMLEGIKDKRIILYAPM